MLCNYNNYIFATTYVSEKLNCIIKVNEAMTHPPNMAIIIVYTAYSTGNPEDCLHRDNQPRGRTSYTTGSIVTKPPHIRRVISNKVYILYNIYLSI